MGKTAGWLVENPLRRRLCLFDDEAIGAVAGDSLGENWFPFSCFPERLPYILKV